MRYHSLNFLWFDRLLVGSRLSALVPEVVFGLCSENAAVSTLCNLYRNTAWTGRDQKNQLDDNGTRLDNPCTSPSAVLVYFKEFPKGGRLVTRN